MTNRHEPVTQSSVGITLMRLNEAKRRQITMGHAATHADIEAAEMLIRALADMAFAEQPAPAITPTGTLASALELAWHPLDTEVRD